MALILPPSLAEALAGLQARLPVGRPVAAENLHLTLAFLGDRDTEALAALDDELAVLARRRFDLALDGLGVFGARAPKLVHAAARPDPALMALQAGVVRAARAAGMVLPRERFRPHVTLARFGGGLGPADRARLHGFLDAMAGFSPPPAPVTGFGLYRSTLRPQGALHEELARYDLI